MRPAGPLQGISREQHHIVIHHFPEDTVFEDTGGFTDPFRYAPHPLVRFAASEVIARIDADPNLRVAFSEGKMLGVLVCSATISDDKHDGSQSRSIGVCSTRPSCLSSTVKGTICYIAAFSGNVAGRSIIDGFVPPIYDLTAPDGHFKKREAEISDINRQIEALLTSDRRLCLERELAEAMRRREKEIEAFKEDMGVSKKRREETRSSCSDSGILEGLIRESQHEKAQFRRLKQTLNAAVDGIMEQIALFNDRIEALKRQRAAMSDELQDWIFRQYIVHNTFGEESCIADIFANQGIVPPGGTGECAAPKLLEYAFRNGLEPLAMGEFWYGKSPDSAVRSHGRFYPSCTSKCGPLLRFMLKGQNLTSGLCIDRIRETEKPIIVFEDDAILVVEKPSGIPSVPGLDGRTSLLELLSATSSGRQHHTVLSSERSPSIMSSERSESRHLHPVHRLDMDTSGIMVFAKTPEAAVNLRKQFEEHSVRKTYMARVSGAPSQSAEASGTVLPPWPQGEGPTKWEGSSQKPPQTGTSRADHIDLPLSADYNERPRQKVDFKQGKPAHTEYQVVKEHHDGTADLLLRPLTGRTHQLRVHCAHHLGLGRPILGDLLYGGHSTHLSGSYDNKVDRCIPERLCLHALSITFLHPTTSNHLTFTSQEHTYLHIPAPSLAPHSALHCVPSPSPSPAPHRAH